MTHVASRELRNNTRALLDRVASGERILITVDGREVAALEPVASRSESMPRERFLRMVGESQADAGLAADLADLAPDTTDDLAW